MKAINYLVRIAIAVVKRQKEKFDLDMTPDMSMNFSNKKPCCSNTNK